MRKKHLNEQVKIENAQFSIAPYQSRAVIENYAKGFSAFAKPCEYLNLCISCASLSKDGLLASSSITT